LFRALVVDYQNTVLTAAQEVENGLVTFLKSQEEVKYQAESVVAAKKAVDLALVQYKGGLVDFNRVATLEVALVQQQDLLAQARGQIATGLINVYRALGGGWEIRLSPPGTTSAPATMPVLPPAPPSQPGEIVPAPKP
jgi:outer membrane protein TolC